MVLVIVWGFALGIASAMQGLGLTPVQPLAAFASQTGILANAYAIVPVTTLALLTALGSVLTFAAGYLLYTVIRWGYSKIPGIN